jgi:hypothetical protein
MKQSSDMCIQNSIMIKKYTVTKSWQSSKSLSAFEIGNNLRKVILSIQIAKVSPLKQRSPLFLAYSQSSLKKIFEIGDSTIIND